MKGKVLKIEYTYQAVEVEGATYSADIVSVKEGEVDTINNLNVSTPEGVSFGASISRDGAGNAIFTAYSVPVTVDARKYINDFCNFVAADTKSK